MNPLISNDMVDIFNISIDTSLLEVKFIIQLSFKQSDYGNTNLYKLIEINSSGTMVLT